MIVANLRSVVYTEALLYLRRRGVWISMALMIVLGLYVATWARQAPWAAWGQFTTTALWVTLLLMFTTGDGITRDRDLRVEGVLLSTPIATPVYVAGKYAAALLMLIGLAGVSLLTALVADAFNPWSSAYYWGGGPLIFGDSFFSPLGPWPYLTGWLSLMIMPLVFGAALVLAAITLMRGQRLVAYGAVLGLWIAPILAVGWPEWLDVTAYKLTAAHGLGAYSPADHLMWTVPHGPHGQAVIARAYHLSLAHLPPVQPPVFYVNRLVFLGLAAVLVMLTTALVARRRRAA